MVEINKIELNCLDCFCLIQMPFFKVNDQDIQSLLLGPTELGEIYFIENKEFMHILRRGH